MPRIPLPAPETFSAEQRRVHDEIVGGPRGGIRGPFLALLHHPELADRWQRLGEILRYRTSFVPRLSELAILVTAREANAQYEWFAHEPHARKGGLAQEVIDALRQHCRPAFANADEEIVYEYALELNRSRSVSEETHRRALERFGVVGTVELTALVGYYNMVAMMLNAQQILPPEGTPLPMPV